MLLSAVSSLRADALVFVPGQQSHLCSDAVPFFSTSGLRADAPAFVPCGKLCLEVDCAVAGQIYDALDSALLLLQAAEYKMRGFDAFSECSTDIDTDLNSDTDTD